MTKKELQFIEELLIRVKPQDEQVAKALSYINKDISSYNARKGQLKEQYEHDAY